ncbi:MAG TPA: glycosyltransferase [Gemmatimonadaceae bacterium]|nr:glycosyltransferase [Gemmatimonadaceae bacterium]
MHVCAISFKECWRDGAGRWLSSGGFPVQMSAIASLFDGMTLLVVEGAPRGGGLPLPRDVRVVPLRAPRGHDLRRKLSVVAGLPHYLRTIARHARRADVVHVPLPGDLPLLGLAVAVLLRRRVLARYGGSWTVTSQTTLMNRVTRTALRLCAGGRTVVLVTGAAAPDAPRPGRAMHWLFATAISRAEVERVRPDLSRPLRRPPRLAYVGRLSPEKGVAVLVEAMARLREMGPVDERPRLVLAGDGPERDRLAALVRERGCDDVITFAGQLDRTALVTLLSETDLCVLPSLTESFCKARLDAMICGVPVVTTEVGFGREIVGADGERGWIVPSGRADALAATLRRALAEPRDWPALRQRCRRYTEALTIEAWTDAIAAICAGQWGLAREEGRLVPRRSAPAAERAPAVRAT